ncbi:MAG: tetratricopeptide repeat protein [Blastocatellia bacterium]
MQKLLSTLFVLVLASTAFAQTGRDMEREKTYWQQLEKIAPKAVAPFKEATEALDSGDYAKAAQYYEAVLKLAPEFEAATRRLGVSYIERGRYDEGKELITRVYEKNPSPANSFSMAGALISDAGDRVPTKEHRERALTLAINAAKDSQEDDPSYTVFAAQLASELNRTKEFAEAQMKLNNEYPKRWETHFINALAAANADNLEQAEREIGLAQTFGMPASLANSMREELQSNSSGWNYLTWTLYLLAAWAIGLVALFVLGKVFSSVTLRSIEQADPNGETSAGESSLRAWYKRLINAASVYYYISLPVVAFLVLAIAGSIIYGFLMIGRIPIKLAGIVIIVALVTVFKMVQSLFIKIGNEDPGRALSQEEAPALWQLTREVAAAINTRPIDEIRITPGCDLAVYEKGSMREKASDRAKRNLILGVAVLNDMNLNAFRAVLAHEYGHFSNRDTAGGDVALRVEQDMTKFAYAMAFSGNAVWWNPAFQFLRAYHFIFRRLSHGATRLQEVLADRVAVRNFGAASFEEGLRHVIRRDVEFNFAASQEIELAQMNQRAVANLYQLPSVKGTANESQIEQEVEDVITRQTTEDDTHPSPIDRFRLAAKITTRGALPANGHVWDLFANREALTEEMSKLINDRVHEATA